MLVDVLVNLWSIDRSRVGLLADLTRVLVVGLRAVLGGCLVGDVFATLSVNSRCLVLVAGLPVLLVKNWLDLCENITISLVFRLP